jgi:hypothetical protein
MSANRAFSRSSSCARGLGELVVDVFGQCLFGGYGLVYFGGERGTGGLVEGDGGVVGADGGLYAVTAVYAYVG